MAVEASVIIELGDSGIDEGSVIVEIDDMHSNNLDADNEVKSSFYPEDSPVIVIHHDSSVVITDVKCTNGSISKIGIDIARSKSLDALFTSKLSEIDIGYFDVKESSFDYKWFGNEITPSLGGTLLKAISGVFPAFTKATFEVNFNAQYKLTPPPLTLDIDETYSIYVVIYVGKA